MATIVSADTTLGEHCLKLLKETGQCPQDVCQADCLMGIRFEGCELSCLPKLCFDIPAGQCPEEFCQVTKGCAGEDVCQTKDSPLQGECGVEGYGGNLACCAGLKKVCGAVDADGECKTSFEDSPLSVPLCLPCGNGICEHMENPCNCPQDC